MADKVIIMLLNIDLERPGTLGAPFFQATVSAAMDLEVEIYFAGPSARLLVQGVADELFPGQTKQKSLYSFMQDAHEAGARFYVCAGAMDEHELNANNAIPEFGGCRGGAAFISEATEDGVLTLTY